MRIARRKFRPSIADSDDWAPVKYIRRQPLIFHPGTAHNGVLALAAKPVAGAKIARPPDVLVHSPNFPKLWSTQIEAYNPAENCFPPSGENVRDHGADSTAAPSLPYLDLAIMRWGKVRLRAAGRQDT